MQRVQGIQEVRGGAQGYRVHAQMSRMSLGFWTELKVDLRCYGNVGTLKEANHRGCNWIPSRNPKSLLEWGKQYKQRRYGRSKGRDTLSKVEGCVRMARRGTWTSMRRQKEHIEGNQG